MPARPSGGLRESEPALIVFELAVAGSGGFPVAINGKGEIGLTLIQSAGADGLLRGIGFVGEQFAIGNRPVASAIASTSCPSPKWPRDPERINRGFFPKTLTHCSSDIG